MDGVKLCHCCGRHLPADREHFYSNNTARLGKDGLDAYCKPCRREITRVASQRTRAKRAGLPLPPRVALKVPRKVGETLPSGNRRKPKTRVDEPREYGQNPSTPLGTPPGVRTEWRPYPSCWRKP